MGYLFLCYAKCTTCSKARNFLETKGIVFEERDIKKMNPSREEIQKWQQKSGLPLKRFFNTSGILYRSLELARRLPKMSEDETLDILASDGMIVKRPILTDGKVVLVGFNEEEWKKHL